MREALVRTAGWAMIASLCSLAVALIVGVGGFRVLPADARAAAVRVTPPTHSAQLLVQAMHRAERAAAVAPAPVDDMIVPDAAHADVAHAQLALRLASAQSTSATLAVQSSAQELTVGTPDLVPGQRIAVSVSFYYCQDGPADYPIGDGGGFCGVMRDGARVYPGAAACAYKYLGQLFKIVGDPTDRIYKCADTGSAVHGLHRDIWFNTSDDGWVWQHSVGRIATIEILP
jgi:hypothetical protein